MWSLKASRWSHASATWWKLPNESGLLVTSAPSDFVGARISQTTGTTKKTANAARIASRRPRAVSPHQSSLLEQPGARDDQHRGEQADHEQVDGDGGGAR